jgi:hypothetical protein
MGGTVRTVMAVVGGLHGRHSSYCNDVAPQWPFSVRCNCFGGALTLLHAGFCARVGHAPKRI